MSASARFRTARSPGIHVGWIRSNAREVVLLSPGAEHRHEKADRFGPLVTLGDSTRATLLRAVAQQRDVESQSSDERVDPELFGALERSRRHLIECAEVLDAGED